MRLIFACITTLFLITSCHKDNTNVCTGPYKHFQVVKIDPSLNSYLFKEGSYWVYQNDATNQIDSQWVSDAGNTDFNGEYPSKCSGGTFVHEYRMQVQSSLAVPDFSYSVIGASLYKDISNSGDPRHGGKYVFNNKDLSFPDSGMEQVEIIPSMTLHGNNLQHVKKIYLRHLNATSSNPYPDNLSDHDLYFYFKDSIGLVKWEVVDGATILESWSLQSWETEW